MKILNTTLRMGLVMSVLAGSASVSKADAIDEEKERFILAHYMPWYEAKPVSPHWGWHWTMNAFDPENEDSEELSLASHYTPLIGAYDSSDPAVIEYHLLSMKLAGIDGVIVDWYGMTNLYDYATLHRNTQLLFEKVEQLGMRFAICYEDQTVPSLVEAGMLSAKERVAHVAGEIEWMAENWFSSPCYVQLDGKPLLLSFGQTGLSDSEWTQCLQRLDTPVAYFSEHIRRTSAMGAFDWPNPSVGLAFTDRFMNDAEAWPHAIPTAFPRFVDVYEQAGVSQSWGYIGDEEGETFRSTLDQALRSGEAITQVVTWNDWGEGTVVEPSVEFGYRDLEVVQELRTKQLDEGFSYSAEDLRLPLKMLEMRRDNLDTNIGKRLDAAALALVSGDVARAKKLLTEETAVTAVMDE
ncbi:hypothetical protein VDG1235_878 [Verrucomicrobiia bacterium DG1235]|nr:hypothetical protein VDG1235_878 [Verrucomicrobiae bacterium DG1235]